ncbi:AMP-binding protein [Corynebacterium pilosum]|uniref:Acyl-CoA synthetase n=1 Tax=Corynebacterium pilosum TaxID=35756 RepID=A0A376CM01_9CORY|nr:AMP-binding protein [Corynebacterium pilosum]STC69470.1 acyl-CoA synthetase [Corynebacterium pilosum]
MSPLPLLGKIAFNAQALAKFVPAVIRSGIVGAEGGPLGAATLPATLARYWFTTAREIEQGAAQTPHRNALIDDDGVLTYAQMRDQAQILAKWFLDVKKREGFDELHIGVMARNGRGILLPMTAKGYAGAHLYLLNVGSSPEQILGIIEENTINVLIVDDEFSHVIPHDYPGLTVAYAHVEKRHDDYPALAELIAHSDTDTKLPAMPKHGYIVLMSSGTTGIPKGILRPEPKLPLVLAGLLEKIPWKAGMTVQMSASMFHTWGWSATNIAFGARNTVVTMRNYDPVRVFEQLEGFKCDAHVSSPIFFKQLLELEDNQKYDTSRLKFIASAGHALTPEIVKRVVDRFGPILCNIYGSTELTLAAAASGAEVAADPTVAGHVSSGTILKLYDDNDQEVPQGKVGRIFLNNSTSLIGYSNPNTPMVKIDNLIEMGDLGYFDADGRLHVVGRADDMIIVGGENVYPASVSDVLESMPGVADLYAGGVDDEETFARIAVWIVRSDDDAGRKLTSDKVRQYVFDNLASHSVPRDVNFVDELPRNAVGKVVPRFLPESVPGA